MFNQYIKSGRDSLSYLQRYKEVAASVKNIVREEHGSVKVYVFGSVLKGNFTASSDIEVLVVLDDVDKEDWFQCTP